MTNKTATNPEEIRIVALGELLWDMLPSGKKLGGAPVNFLYHAQSLGAQTQALTSIGADDLGREILTQFSNLGLSSDFLQIHENVPTGTVAVTLDANGSPQYEIVENVAWDKIEVDAATATKCNDFLTKTPGNSAFYYGSLALRSEVNRRSLQILQETIDPSVMRVCDLNLRKPFYDPEVIELTLQYADVFKLNDAEAVVLDQALSHNCQTFDLAKFADADDSLVTALSSEHSAQVENALSAWANAWLQRYRLKELILTCGSYGAYLFDKSTRHFAKSSPVKVKDAVGAGDSFCAVCVVGLLMNASKDTILSAAAQRAAFVCEQDGATPKIPEILRRPFNC